MWVIYRVNLSKYAMHGAYGLWKTYNKLRKITIFHWATRYKWTMFTRYVKLPETGHFSGDTMVVMMGIEMGIVMDVVDMLKIQLIPMGILWAFNRRTNE